MFEDRYLMVRAQRGDWTAFERIYQKYLDTLLTIALNLLGNPQEAEDAVQDVFAKLINTLKEFHLKGSLKGFLATCVANRCRDVLRSHKRRVHYHDTMRDRIEETSSSVCHTVVQTELIGRLQQALQQLSLEQREMVVLKIHSGQSFRALARQLDVPLGTVQARYRAGLVKLKDLLNGDDSI